MPDQTLPTDLFSKRRRELVDNPGAIRAASTVNLQDFYGNLETWIVETFRLDGTAEALIQRNSIDGALRLVVPPLVMATIDRQLGHLVTVARRRSARQAVETKRSKGQRIGNPEALRKGRKAKAKK
jgi:hypothetical protein